MTTPRPPEPSPPDARALRDTLYSAHQDLLDHALLELPRSLAEGAVLRHLAPFPHASAVLMLDFSASPFALQCLAALVPAWVPGLSPRAMDGALALHFETLDEALGSDEEERIFEEKNAVFERLLISAVAITQRPRDATNPHDAPLRDVALRCIKDILGTRLEGVPWTGAPWAMEYLLHLRDPDARDYLSRFLSTPDAMDEDEPFFRKLSTKGPAPTPNFVALWRTCEQRAATPLPQPLRPNLDAWVEHLRAFEPHAATITSNLTEQ